MLGAAAAALGVCPALAAPSPPSAPAVPAAESYADLLEPIPNAVELLRASDAEAAMRPARLIPAQWVNHHHHHHDSAWYQRNGYNWYGGRWVLRPAHHHHHNRWWYMQNGYFWNGGAWVLRPAPHHHHHHHSNY